MLETHSRNSFAVPSGRCRSILVVEDDQAVGTVLELVLKVAGHDVDIVGDSAAARAALETATYDLVLLDLQLLSGHGFDVLQHLRQVLRRSTPVIVLSSARAEENRPRSLELGANEYIAKPFSSEEIIARVRHWTEAAA